jgi:hypothetical protein
MQQGMGGGMGNGYSDLPPHLAALMEPAPPAGNGFQHHAPTAAYGMLRRERCTGRQLTQVVQRNFSSSMSPDEPDPCGRYGAGIGQLAGGQHGQPGA